MRELHDDRDDDDAFDVAESPVPMYAPLLDRRVAVDTLEVALIRGFERTDCGRGTQAVIEDATDEDGNLIELLVTDLPRDLQERICHPGRYRITARCPVTGQILAQKDRILRPQKGKRQPEVAPRVKANPAPPPKALLDDSPMVELLKGQVAQLAEARDTLDKRLQDTHDALRRSDVDAAAYREKASAAQARVTELEARLTEAQTQLAEVQAMLTHAQKQIADADFSPLDAIGQLDGAMDLISRTVDRFKG